MFRVTDFAGIGSQPVSHELVKNTVASVLKRIPNAPHIEVYRTPADTGITISGPMPKGGVLQDGRIPTWHIWDDFIRHFQWVAAPASSGDIDTVLDWCAPPGTLQPADASFNAATATQPATGRSRTLSLWFMHGNQRTGKRTPQ